MPNKLVSINMTANTPNIIAATPDICPVKYKMATIIAKVNLMSLSKVPIFFFMAIYRLGDSYLINQYG